MIPSSAASVAACWERPRVLRLEQRQVAGQEPPSGRRSEGRPEYSGALLVRLRRHRARITAIQPTDLLLTDLRHMDTQATDPQPTHSRAMDIRDTPVLPRMLVH